MYPLIALFSLAVALATVNAATKDHWRPRSVYHLITDRFAPPTPDKQCDIRAYCGGTWRTTIDRLDYIQGMGFDAILISPTGLGLDGETKWGENYHGYWSVDPFAINPHFGTSDDLKALSSALHDRGMYLMVDIAVNHLAATDTDISDSALAAKSGGKLLFQKQIDYHPACKIKWGDKQSELTCWLAQDGVALMDLRTEDKRVADVLKQRFVAYMAEYKIDGARVDATKIMAKEFQHDFCKAANTFCIGEVFDGSTAIAGDYTQGEGIDSVFGFGMMWGAQDVFGKDRPMSALSRRAEEASASYSDPTVIGAILDNHDLPRFNSLTNDRSKVSNAMALQFLFGGIPTMYYGLEQDISFGKSDPDNRAPLWQFGNLGTGGESYARIKKLNKIRKSLGGVGGFHESVGKTVAVTENDIAFARNGTLLVLTKRGAGQAGDWTIGKAGFPAKAKLVDLLTCSNAFAGADGSLKVTFGDGQPFVSYLSEFYVTEDLARRAEICRAPAQNQISSSSSSSISSTSAVPTSSSTASASSVPSTATTSPSSSISENSSVTITVDVPPITVGPINGLPAEASPVLEVCTSVHHNQPKQDLMPSEVPATSRPIPAVQPTSRPSGTGGSSTSEGDRRVQIGSIAAFFVPLVCVTIG